MKPRPLIRLVALLAVAAALWLARQSGSLAGSPATPAPASGAAAASAVAYPEIGFRDAGRLHEHFQKHGAEFGGIAESEYLTRAQILRDRPAGGSVLESVRTDGVVTRFDRSSGAFLAFDRDRTIRTFFRPNDGERYFTRQLTRARSER